jgi:hypothetical protein
VRLLILVFAVVWTFMRTWAFGTSARLRNLDDHELADVMGAPALRRAHVDQLVAALWPARVATRSGEVPGAHRQVPSAASAASSPLSG